MRFVAVRQVRTAFVTGLVPAFFVGGIVSMFQQYQRQADTESDVFRLYAATLMTTLYPAYYLLPWVDRWAPLWLGGHVLGFGSFFAFMVLTDADLMKNDHLLELEAPPPGALQQTMHQIKLARLEAKLQREAAEAAKRA